MSSETDADTEQLVWPWLAVGALALGGALAVGSTLWRGSYRSVIPAGSATPTAAATASAAAGGAAPHGIGPEPLRVLTEQLQARLRRNPGDADGWAMLARTHAVGGQHDRAVPAFRQAVALRPEDAVLLVDFADALSRVQGGNLNGEPAALVQRALRLAPDHPKALSLAGRDAFERRDWKTAVQHWERLVAVAGDHSVFVRQVRLELDAARRQAGASAR